MKRLFEEKYDQYGIELNAYDMDNMERRLRMVSNQSVYIRTESKETHWQKSHFHSEQLEYYLVEKGEVLLAQLIEGNLKITKYQSGGAFCIIPNQPHNLCISNGGILHTVKFGGMNDWISSPELDDMLGKEKVNLQR